MSLSKVKIIHQLLSWRCSAVDLRHSGTKINNRRRNPPKEQNKVMTQVYGIMGQTVQPVLLCLFLYDLFKDVVGTSEYMTSHFTLSNPGLFLLTSVAETIGN
jgi:hypothetical protein